MPESQPGTPTNAESTASADSPVEEVVKPDCQAASREHVDWRTSDVTEASSEFFDSCNWCYGDEQPRVGDTAVRSRGKHGGGTLHRLDPRSKDAHGEKAGHSTEFESDGDADADSDIDTDADVSPEPGRVGAGERGDERSQQHSKGAQL